MFLLVFLFFAGVVAVAGSFGEGYLLEGCLKVLFGFGLCWVNMLFFGVLTVVYLSVLFFSSLYMEKEVFFRFFSVGVLSFVVSMVVFVFGSSWVVVFLGWEWLGLTSLVLIGFFFSGYSISSSLKTALMNRVGDVFLFFAGVVAVLGVSLLVQLCFLVLGGLVKSAQWPFSAWLPAAMAAPTPVSALVHSSTLVTAGVWLIFSSGFSMFSMLLVGLVSSFVGGVMAIWEMDMKKVVAFSTLSQLGFLFLCCGFAVSDISIFYLFSHAFFKSLLFISVGVFIFSTHNQLFSLKGDSKSNVLLFLCFSSLGSMMGVHFLSGFFLKHEILFWVGDFSFGFWGAFLALCFLTVAYSIRLMFVLLGLGKVGVSLNVGFGAFFLVLASCVLGSALFCGGSVFCIGGGLMSGLLLAGVVSVAFSELWFYNFMYFSSVCFFWLVGVKTASIVSFFDELLGGGFFLLGKKLVNFDAFVFFGLVGVLWVACF